MDNTRTLDIPGATRKVEVEGVLGLFYKVRVGGEVIKRSRGFWAIPTTGGKTSKLTSNGVLPGFQTLRLDGEPVFKMGAHVPTAAKVAMFAPAALIVFVPIGVVLAVLMFLTNIVLVKNPQLPVGVRTALPIVNTVVIFALMNVLVGLPW